MSAYDYDNFASKNPLALSDPPPMYSNPSFRNVQDAKKVDPSNPSIDSMRSVDTMMDMKAPVFPRYVTNVVDPVQNSLQEYVLFLKYEDLTTKKKGQRLVSLADISTPFTFRKFSTKPLMNPLFHPSPLFGRAAMLTSLLALICFAIPIQNAISNLSSDIIGAAITVLTVLASLGAVSMCYMTLSLSSVVDIERIDDRIRDTRSIFTRLVVTSTFFSSVGSLLLGVLAQIIAKNSSSFTVIGIILMVPSCAFSYFTSYYTNIFAAYRFNRLIHLRRLFEKLDGEVSILDITSFATDNSWRVLNNADDKDFNGSERRYANVAGLIRRNVLYKKLPKENLYVPLEQWAELFERSQILEILHAFQLVGAVSIAVNHAKSTIQSTVKSPSLFNSVVSACTPFRPTSDSLSGTVLFRLNARPPGDYDTFIANMGPSFYHLRKFPHILDHLRIRMARGILMVDKFDLEHRTPASTSLPILNAIMHQSEPFQSIFRDPKETVTIETGYSSTARAQFTSTFIVVYPDIKEAKEIRYGGADLTQPDTLNLAPGMYHPLSSIDDLDILNRVKTMKWKTQKKDEPVKVDVDAKKMSKMSTAEKEKYKQAVREQRAKRLNLLKDYVREKKLRFETSVDAFLNRSMLEFVLASKAHTPVPSCCFQANLKGKSVCPIHHSNAEMNEYASASVSSLNPFKLLNHLARKGAVSRKTSKSSVCPCKNSFFSRSNNRVCDCDENLKESNGILKTSILGRCCPSKKQLDDDDDDLSAFSGDDEEEDLRTALDSIPNALRKDQSLIKDGKLQLTPIDNSTHHSTNQQESVWTKHISTEDGREYYHNSITKESSYDRPPEYID
jgi:WW domain